MALLCTSKFTSFKKSNIIDYECVIDLKTYDESIKEIIIQVYINCTFMTSSGNDRLMANRN